MNRGLQEAYVPEWMTKGSTTLIQKNRNKQLQPHKMSTYNVENTNGTNKERDLLHWGIVKCHRGPRDTGEPLYIDQHILNVSKTRR